MKEKDIEKNLEKLKEHIPVNYQLKEKLKKEFKKNTKKSYKFIAIAASLLLIVGFALASFLSHNNYSPNYITSPSPFISKANAADLKIANQISFFDIGKGNTGRIAEYNGTLYIAIPEKGLFEYNKNGFRQIVGEKSKNVPIGVGDVAVSPDGKKLLYSLNYQYYIKDLSTDKTEKIRVTGNGLDIFYESPSFSPDGNKIIFTKNVYTPREGGHGFEKKSTLWEYDLKTSQLTEIAEGSYGSYVKNQNAIVFEKDNKIIYKDLKTGEEKTVDEGRFPSVSPDGNYIAYVKSEIKNSTIDGVEVTEHISNVWVTDAVGFATKKQVTENFSKPNLKSLVESVKEKNKNSPIKSDLVTEGEYDYYLPSWSNDSNSIYVLKNLNEDVRGNMMTLMKIDLSKEKLSADYTVRRFLQALIARDDDFAKMLMKNPPSFLTISNPHPVGYNILGTGKEGEKTYVDAELYMGYWGDTYYSIEKQRYYVTPSENGYIIDSIKGLETLEFYDKNNTFYERINREKGKSLFRETDIPKEYLPEGNFRFTASAFDAKTNTLYFTVLGLDNRQSKLLSYNLDTKTFKLVNSIDNGAFAELKLDGNGNFLAANFFSDDGKQKVYLYNLKTGEKTDLETLFKDTKIDEIEPNFWNQDKLMFKISTYGISLMYEYNPVKSQISIP